MRQYYLWSINGLAGHVYSRQYYCNIFLQFQALQSLPDTKRSIPDRYLTFLVAMEMLQEPYRNNVHPSIGE